jgi:putative ABC transport system permease protein
MENNLAASQAAGAIPTAVDSLTIINELRALKADPLTLGLRSLTLMGASLAALISLAGFATFLYMSISRRETTFAILRSLGLSSGGLYGMLVVEQVVMVLAGLLLGGLLGFLLNYLVVPGLPLSLGGRPPIPPMLPLTDWSAVLRFSLVLAGAFMLVVGTATFILWRARLQHLLRIGQE